MKNILAISSVCCAASVFAATTMLSTDGLIGACRVDSSLKETVIGIPWVATDGTSSIAVKDIVKTSNLTVGDELYYYNGSTYDCWQLASDGTWTRANSVTTSGLTISTPTADQAVTRGSALILVRKDKPTEAFSFYLYGTVPTSGNPTTSVAAGTVETPVYTLIASPAVADVNLNSSDDITFANVGAKDRLYVPSSAKRGLFLIYQRDSANAKWIRYVNGTKQETATLAAGCGAWYENRGGNIVTVTWKTAPVRAN